MTHPIDYGHENLDPGELERVQAFKIEIIILKKIT